MNAEDLTFNDGTDAKIVENLSAVLPRVGISVLSNRLVIEAVDSSNLSSLMVSSEQSDVSWVLEFEAKQKLECFH